MPVHPHPRPRLRPSLARAVIRAAILTSLAAGCRDGDDGPSRLLVVVDSDFLVTDELELLGVRTRDAQGQTVSRIDIDLAPGDDAPGAGESRFALPLSFAVEPLGGDARRRIRLDIGAFRRDIDQEPLFTRTAVTGFSRGRTLLLPMFLSRRCERVVCDPGFTCTETGCAPEEIDPGSLVEAPATLGDELASPCPGGCPGRPAGGRAFVAGRGLELRGVGVGGRDGGLYLGGEVRGEADLGTGPTGEDDRGDPDAWIGAYAEDGRALWVLRSTETGPDAIRDLVPHPDGGIVVSGLHRGLRLDPEGPSLPAGDDPDGFVARIDPDGRVRWITNLGGPGDDRISGLGVGPDGQVYAGLALRKDARLGVDGPILTAVGSEDAALVALDGGSGDYRFHHQVGGPGDEAPRHVAADAAGHAFLVCVVEGDTELGGPGPGDPQGGRDAAMVALDAATGDVLWASRFGSSGGDSVTSIAGLGDPVAGGAVLTGAFRQTFTYRAGAQDDDDDDDGPGEGDPALLRRAEAAGSRDAYLLAVDGASGRPRWLTTLGGADSEEGLAVTTDVRGLIYVAGVFAGDAADIGLGPIAAVGGTDAFVASFDPDGTFRWSRALAGPGDDRALGLTVQDDGRVQVVGRFDRQLLAGATELPGAEDHSSGFLITFEQTGLAAP